MAKIKTPKNGGAAKKVKKLSQRKAKILVAFLIECLRSVAPIDTGNLNGSISNHRLPPVPVGMRIVARVYMAVYGKWVMPKGGGKRGKWIQDGLKLFRRGVNQNLTENQT